ncbi:ABC transporter permease [Peribacillus tepidiphilus]|uniref:ABC transporter permease n=1 Tax=Peribacillus tepidiphilus TaxID=2652445 RepID=UPI001292677F|nr:ABC transporter permease subunit [Peribacillus tepidiphilus]
MKLVEIARQQFILLIRSKWIYSFGLLFTILAIVIVSFGDSFSAGNSGFNRTSASLLNLNLFLIPLVSLLMGSLFISGEKEDQGLLLLLTYPVSVHKVILGKFLGLCLALWTVLSAGYGISAWFMYFFQPDGSLAFLFTFYFLSILLGFIFLSISVLVGFLSKSRFQALGMTLMSWALFVLFYEFIVMGLTMLVHKAWILPVFSLSILLNPVELIRVWSILLLKGEAVFGPSLYDLTIWAKNIVGQFLFILSAMLWIVLPLLVSLLVIQRRVANE